MEIASVSDQNPQNGDATSLLESSQTHEDPSFNESYDQHIGNPAFATASAAANFNMNLINAVSSFPCLYDPEHPSYKEPATKEQSWNAVASQINYGASECRRKWRNLRDVYMRNRKKFEASGNPNTICWSFYNALHSFLHDKVKITVDPNYDLLQESLADGSFQSPHQTSPAQASAPPRPKSKVSKRPSSSSIFKPFKAAKRARQAHPDRPPDPRAGHQANTSPASSNVLWGQSIGMRLDKLSLFEQGQFRIKVETLMMETEMQYEHIEHVEQGHVTLHRVDDIENGDCKASVFKVDMGN